MKRTLQKQLSRLTLPDYIFFAGVCVAIVSLLAFYFVDLRNVFGLRDILFAVNPLYFYTDYVPLFFAHWGRNGGLAEILQYGLLGSSALIMMYCAGSLYARRIAQTSKEARRQTTQLFMFTLLIAVALLLMLMQDAAGIRHTLMGYVQAIADEQDQGVFGTLFEMLYFIVLGGIPVYAYIRYGAPLKQLARAKVYIIIAYVFYFAAGSLSFAGTAFSKLVSQNVYEIAGDKFYNFALSIGDPGLQSAWAALQATHWWYPIAFNLMDHLVEENLELIAAGAFLAAATSIYIFVNNTNTQNSEVKPTP
ncbi:MAG: hypothetical protein U5K77_03525 [Candidatus Saccharibacteria bacterium]|nr:hypothetical protein [Candidatus Saccharibacteria bacterium]